MKKILLYASLFLVQPYAFAQEKLVKDIDFDGKQDTVYIDQKLQQIICELSTQNFKKLRSRTFEMSGDNTYIKPTRNGFELRNTSMRSGFACQFRYEKVEKRIRLIGITEYAFGNAANDGSGKASANLLTGQYIGDWYYYDQLANNQKGELVKIPTIKKKMKFNKIYLEGFSEESYFSYSTQLEGMVEEHKMAEQKRRSKKE